MTTEALDMLKTPHLNDEIGFSELTIITLLRYSDRNALKVERMPSTQSPFGQ